MPSDNIPAEVNNTANPFPSFLKEVNFYKKNYPSKQSVGSGNLSTGSLVGRTSDDEGEKYILFNSILTGQGFNLTSLLSIEIKESLFTPYMSGTLELFDEYNLIETVNFTGNETIEIVFSLQNLQNDIKLRFKVISAKAITDLSTVDRINFLEPARVYQLEFISEEIFNHTFTDALLKDEKDFIGYIAVDSENNTEIKGLVNEISRQLELSPIEIEETKNGIWLKQNEISYPTGKDHGQYPFINLMQQIITYAVSKDNPNAVNYFFWKDREGWKFKSLNSLIKAGKDKVKFTQLAEITNSFLGDVFKQSDLTQTYILETDDDKNPYKVWNAIALNHLDSMKLYAQKAYSSYYKSITPDYTNPYSNFLDTTAGFTSSIVDYDYHRDFDKIEHIEEYKLISDDIETSPLVIKNTNRRTKNAPEKLTIPAFRYGEDSVYGFYDNLRYNTPFGQWIYNSADMGFGKKVEDPAVVWWDYLGRSGDSRWSNTNWQPQFDLTELDVKTLYTINKKIREPLKQKRQKFAHLKNIKRKWEVYRCAVCCLEGANAGGTADAELIKQYQGLSGATFNILFGATGIFSDMKQEYKLVAAGSFTDTLNYDSGDTGSEYGLTLSYNFNEEPYNQSIGQFFNFKEDLPNYKKYIFERGLNIYKVAIETTEKRLNNVENFIQNVDTYIGAVDNWITQHLVDCSQGNSPSSNPYGFGNVNYGERPASNSNISCGNNTDYSLFYTAYPNGGKIPNLTIPKGLCWKPTQFACPNKEYYEPIPDFIIDCSKDIVVSPIEVLNNYITEIDGTYYRYYGLYQNYYDWLYPFQVNSYYEANNPAGELKRCIEAGDCYKTVCFNPIALELQKRIAQTEVKALKVQLELLKYSQNIVTNSLIPNWEQQYSEWYNRPAFFVSKQPGVNIFTGITGGGRTGPVTQPLSLYNVKSVKRKPIRGSRYELLARSKGLTGSQVGEWVYNIFFGNDPSVSSTIKHPYYDQGYSEKNGKGSFVTQRNGYYIYSYEDSNPLNNPPWQTQYAEVMKDPSEYTERSFVTNPANVVDQYPEFKKIGLTMRDLESLEGYSDEGFRETFNIFQDDLTNKKPPNIKKEEISSYVRIEFTNPIGLDRIADFPNGFVRDAGSEYFLPYLVQVTPGPSGRQATRNNIAVIGMDPYGFDVAIKKLNVDDDKENRSRDYWWATAGDYLINTGLSENGMDLWPEVGFETSRPYYTTDARGSWNDGTQGDYYGYSSYGDWWDYTINSNYWTPGVDPELKQSSHGSNYFQASYRRIKPHRSWWSFHFPKNIYVPSRFFGLYNSLYGPWYEGFTNSGSFTTYGYWDYIWWYGGDVDKWIRLADTPDTRNLLSQAEYDDKVIIPKFEDGFVETMNVYTADSVEILHPELKKYFSQAALHWMNSDYSIYRPGIISDELWKYDLSGETEYGLVSPPTISPNYDIFDNNFSAQFIVHARSTSICQQFTCANPNGLVSGKECPEDNPYCNCPAQEHIPEEREPTYLELYQLYNELKECELIKEYLGEDYLGCIWIDPNNPCSCNCPEIGKKFSEYLEYTKTYATYWDTPKNTPLIRNALISQFMSQQISIGIIPNDNIKVGDMIRLVHKKLITKEEDGAISDDNDSKRFDGLWIVSEIRHRFTKESSQTMQLVLNRDTIPRKPN